MSSLQTKGTVLRANLLENDYFPSLLREARRTRLLSNENAEHIQGDMLALLAEETKRFTRGESSSVPVERAHSLLKSICYSIGIFLKQAASPEEGIAVLKEQSVRELFWQGQTLIKKQVGIAKLMYRQVWASRIETRNMAYNDTIGAGISSFFKQYEPEFSGHETPAMIDYPIGGSPIETEGVEYILEYEKRLLEENRFCKQFTAEEIHAVMMSFDVGYADLLENIYEQVAKRVLPDGRLEDVVLPEVHSPKFILDDGQRMADEEFRDFIEQLGECSSADEKVAMMHERLHSFTDWVDVLESGSLYGGEFDAVFASLEKSELALLLKETITVDMERLTEYEKEWKMEFIFFLKELEPETRREIELLSNDVAVKK